MPSQARGGRIWQHDSQPPRCPPGPGLTDSQLVRILLEKAGLQVEECSRCAGTGMDEEWTCRECDGAGEIVGPSE